MSNMDTETYNELRFIIANIWLDIEEGFREIPREFCWWAQSEKSLQPGKERQKSKGFYLPVPKKHREHWLKAMNILSHFKVFRFRLFFENGQPMHYLSLDDLPAEPYYIISDFSIHSFLSFCDRFKFDLTQPILKAHRGSLSINADNVPIIMVDGINYYLRPLNKSTLANMLKIAFQPSLRNVPLDKSKLNREGGNPDVIAQVLGGERFHLGETVKRLKKYHTDIELPRILDEFYVLTDKAILGKGAIHITDTQLEEIQELAEYTEPNHK